MIRMTEKRFINDIDDGKLIDTKGELSTIHYSDKVDFYELWEFLNKLNDENEQLKFENNELKCALALDAVDYIIADGKKIDIPPFYEFEQRYDYVMHRREYDGYD